MAPTDSTPHAEAEAITRQASGTYGAEGTTQDPFDTGAARSSEAAQFGQPLATGGKGRTLAIVAATLLLVAAVGTLVAYKFLHQVDDAPSASQIAEGSAPSASPQAAGSAVTAPSPGAAQPAVVTPPGVKTALSTTGVEPPAPTVATARPAASSTMAAEAQVEPVSPNMPNQTSAPPQPDPVVTRNESLTEGGAATVASMSSRPARAQATRAAAAVPAAAPMQDIALSLVRKGELAFAQQDYSTAIANAKAALEVKPGLSRAQHLLDEAQRAQQRAMSSISIQ